MEKPRNLMVRQLFPTPDPPAPTKMRCVSVYIPDSMDHLAAFAGALALLGKWNSWQKDDAHTARLAAVAWQQCNLRGIRDCDTNDTIMEVELEDDMGDNIRVDPDNQCIIQIKCCGEWTTLIDISKCVPSGVTQPTNGEPIDPGDCREWDVPLDSWSKWLLPVVVNAGDTIEISAAGGATNDGASLDWRCIDGQVMILGGCTGSPTTSGTDPAPSVAHQRLIVSVDGAFYDAYNRIVAVLPGVTDGQVFFQVNTDDLNGMAGSVSFHVKVCKAATTYALTPIWGTGPAVVSPGQEFVWSSQANGGFYQSTFLMAPCAASLTILSLTGWSLYTTGSVYGWHDCAHVLHAFNYPTTTTIPIPQTVDAEDWAVFSATPFTMVCRID